MKTISLVMIAKNEEDKIERCLSSVKDLINEIILVDTGSTDKTKDLALKYGAKIYDYVWDDNFSNARNFALEKSSGDWNLILDADEYVVGYDIDNFREFVNNNSNCIGKVKRIDFFEQSNEIRNTQVFISRLAPNKARYFGGIHEQLDSKYPRKNVDLTLEHDGYLDSNKFERNISLLLKELKFNPNDSYILYQLGKTYYVNKMYSEASIYLDKFYEYCKPKSDAFYNDGVVIYIYNTIVTKEFEKGLAIISNSFDTLNDYCDFYFVCGVFFTELVSFDPSKYGSYFNNIELSYLSALEIGENNIYDSVEGTGSYLAAYNLSVFYDLIGNTKKSLEYSNLSTKYSYNINLESIK